MAAPPSYEQAIAAGVSNVPPPPTYVLQAGAPRVDQPPPNDLLQTGEGAAAFNTPSTSTTLTGVTNNNFPLPSKSKPLTPIESVPDGASVSTTQTSGVSPAAQVASANPRPSAANANGSSTTNTASRNGNNNATASNSNNNSTTRSANNNNSNSSNASRAGHSVALTDMKNMQLFLRKVTLILMVGIACTIPLQSVYLVVPHLYFAQRAWMFFVPLVVFVLTSIILFAHRENRVTHPKNKICMVVHHVVLTLLLVAGSCYMESCAVMLMSLIIGLTFLVVAVFLRYGQTGFSLTRFRVVVVLSALIAGVLVTVVAFFTVERKDFADVGIMSASGTVLAAFLLLNVARMTKDTKYRLTSTVYWWSALQTWVEILFMPIFIFFAFFYVLGVIFNCKKK